MSFRFKRYWHSLIGRLSLAILTAILIVSTVNAAEKIIFIYPPLNVSLSINSLETFAKTGKINSELAFYLDKVGVNEEEKQAFRQALNTKITVDPALLSRLLNTDIGEDILNLFGDIINIQGGRNGKFVIRGSLVQSALSEEGLTLINFLRNLPVNVQINIQRSIILSTRIQMVINATRVFSEKTALLAAEEARQEPLVNYSNLPDLRSPGNLAVKKEHWDLVDEKRSRSFFVDVYYPDTVPLPKTQVIIISHGLASRPGDFARQAEYLASYGYLVAVPQHPGSDFDQLARLLNGETRQLFLRQEFIDRPLDIKYVIDEISRSNLIVFGEQLDLENVGVFGHSFGGYAALALGGATIDFEHLQNDCSVESQRLNTSLLLQCRALKLGKQDYNFKDPRVKAVYASNPVNSSIFGPKGLGKVTIPVFLGAGTYDPATPFVFEQVRSFPWLTHSPYKYLMLQEGQAHVDFSQIDAGITTLIESITDITLPTPQLLEEYSLTTMLAFFKMNINNDPYYQIFLRSSYLEYLSKGQDFKAYLISKISSEALSEAIEEFKLQNPTN